MGLLNIIRSKDFFGFPVELDFNGKGSTHNTYIGGFLSLIVRIFMIIFIASLFIKLFTYGDDSISTIFSQQEIQDLKPVIFGDTGYSPTF